MERNERARFDLDMILPYVNFLKNEVNQGLRIERRKEQADWIRELQDKSIHNEEVNYFRARSFSVPSGVIFEQPEVKEMMRQNKEPK